jgi:hypothetical protein
MLLHRGVSVESDGDGDGDDSIASSHLVNNLCRNVMRDGSDGSEGSEGEADEAEEPSASGEGGEGGEDPRGFDPDKDFPGVTGDYGEYDLMHVAPYRTNRFVIYQSNQLHSGIITLEGAKHLSCDPKGRHRRTAASYFWNDKHVEGDTIG